MVPTHDQGHARPSGGARPRALVVDDHVDTAELLQLLLEKRGLEVVLAASCRAALAEINEQRFDILISDIDLPDGNGCDLLSSAGAQRPAVAIAVSGVSDQTLLRSCREAGFDELFTKPASFQRVLDSALQRLAAIEH